MIEEAQPRPLVLVAGACLGGWAWREVATPLRAAGHEVFPVTLTGLAERVHLAHPGVDLETHIADVVNLLDYEELDDAVLLGHSYAGAVVTGVADRRPERIHALVYLDTGPLPGGMSIADVQPPELHATQRREVERDGEGWRWPVPSREALETGAYGSVAGLDDRHFAMVAARGTPQPWATFTSPLRLQGPPPPRVSRVAIFGAHGALSVATLRELIAQGDPRVGPFADPGWELHELPTGHWAMLSLPGPLADLLQADRAPGVAAYPTAIGKACSDRCGSCSRATPRSAARLDGSQSSQTSSRRLAFVVADERVQRGEVDGGCDMDRVERSEDRLGKGACGREQTAVEWEEGERLEQLPRAPGEEVEGKTRVVRPRPPDRARHLREHELAGNEIGVGEEGAQRPALGLVVHQLDQRRSIGIEERHLSARREPRRARGSARRDRRRAGAARATRAGSGG